MKITVKLFATLRLGNEKVQVMELPEGTTPEAIMQRLSIPPDTVSIIMINGRGSKPDSALKDGDVLALFPPVGGG